MENIKKYIKERRSVRTYDGREITEEMRKKLMSFAGGIANPLGIPVVFRFLEAKRDGLTCPVVSGTELYVGGKTGLSADSDLAFGYSFETFVLYAQSLGLGTVWLGGTMNRPAFEKAMELREGETMPCAAAIGYASAKMSLRESMMRKAIKADERMSFEELFFGGSFDSPLSPEAAGMLADALEAVRLAPSAVNKQPWRVVTAGNAAHFYLRRSKGFSREGKLDMQMIDMGIALCHFALTAEEGGSNPRFVRSEPDIPHGPELEYIASYLLDLK